MLFLEDLTINAILRFRYLVAMLKHYY